jgi:predicted metal-dependent phosphoesterase TrpH
VRKGGRRIDLHTHSTASDGVYTPSEVVRLALERDLAALALTDHDTLSGIPEARAAAAGSDLEFIAGVEISCEGEWGDVHMLGLYVDPENAELADCLDGMRAGRLRRARGMVSRLQGMGFELEWDEVQALAAGESIGRPHIARAMVDRGQVGSIEEAFASYLGRNGPAYVSRPRLTPCEAIERILAAGGVPVLAHPAFTGEQAVGWVPELVDCGLRGLEVYYPRHDPRDVARLLGLCQQYRLLATGGSDFHSPDGSEGVELGSVHVPFECLEPLRRAAKGQAGRKDAV